MDPDPDLRISTVLADPCKGISSGEWTDQKDILFLTWMTVMEFDYHPHIGLKFYYIQGRAINCYLFGDPIQRIVYIDGGMVIP